MKTVTRHSRKPTISGRTAISSHAPSVRHFLGKNLGNAGVHNSVAQAHRQNLGDLSRTSHSGQGHPAKIQIANNPSLMSMHSVGDGIGLRQTHGATNLMRMESGMLAQPGIGAGLGGVSGNGLGGGGGPNHGGNRTAK
ncbi:MAG TPA: hypothetical protein VLK27_10300 [Chthoniobacterales bacterium]|nr:hypothetical protein [Chthoniobacterales bacterium]